MPGSLVIVSGASSGIGLALARSVPCCTALISINPGLVSTGDDSMLRMSVDTPPLPPARQSTKARSTVNVNARNKSVKPITSSGPPCFKYSGELSQIT